MRRVTFGGTDGTHYSLCIFDKEDEKKSMHSTSGVERMEHITIFCFKTLSFPLL